MPLESLLTLGGCPTRATPPPPAASPLWHRAGGFPGGRGLLGVVSRVEGARSPKGRGPTGRGRRHGRRILELSALCYGSPEERPWGKRGGTFARRNMCWFTMRSNMCRFNLSRGPLGRERHTGGFPPVRRAWKNREQAQNHEEDAQQNRWPDEQQ